jgi:hypothetical protein
VLDPRRRKPESPPDVGETIAFAHQSCSRNGSVSPRPQTDRSAQ